MWLWILASWMALAHAVVAATGPQDLSMDLVERHLDLWARLENMTLEFERVLRVLRLPTELHYADWRTLPDDRDFAICTVCRSVLKVFLHLRREGMSEDCIRQKATKLCVLLNLQTANVCKGVVSLNLPIILSIVDRRPNLTASTICGVILESNSCPLTDPQFEWIVNIDEGPKKSVPLKADNEIINVVQITDIHYDPNYEPNGNTECGEPTCCRRGQNSSNVDGNLAGYWGDYNHCDSPWHSVVDTLDHIRDTHRTIDYIYFTGDIIDHGVWETTKEGNKESLNKSYTKIYETFEGIPVYPILGNHEPHPLNLFAPSSVTEDGLSTRWLYEYLADMWINFGWLPESTRLTIVRGGFYTVSLRKGFRIVAINNNVCYCYNWWLWYEPEDPDGQLQWLSETLLKAERDGEFVHILAHIPAADDHCQRTWRREYLKIVNRYSHLITAQFNGHTHFDELQIFYEEEDYAVANNLAWNGGSVTTFSYLNPNYKVYRVNGNDYAVMDYENWTYNLTQANENPEKRPEWYRSYSFKEEYNLQDLSVRSVNEWFMTMTHDESNLNRYYRHFLKNPIRAETASCDSNCKKRYLCRAVASVTDLKMMCKISL